MRKATETAITNRIQDITGLTNDELDFVVGTAVITATLGKFPTKVDAYTYLGMNEREMDTMMQQSIDTTWTDRAKSLKKWFYHVGLYEKPRAKAMIYTLAADLTLEGLLDGDTDDKVRQLLRAVVQPQDIQCRAAFDGLQVALEYLQHRERGLDTSLPQFMRLRYGALRKYNALEAFSELVAANDPGSFPKSDYGYVIGHLRELLEVSE